MTNKVFTVAILLAMAMIVKAQSSPALELKDNSFEPAADSEVPELEANILVDASPILVVGTRKASFGSGSSLTSSTCSNGIKDSFGGPMDGSALHAETGIDCGGGVCPLCPVGQGCIHDSDCAPGLYCPIQGTASASLCAAVVAGPVPIAPNTQSSGSLTEIALFTGSPTGVVNVVIDVSSGIATSNLICSSNYEERFGTTYYHHAPSNVTGTAFAAPTQILQNVSVGLPIQHSLAMDSNGVIWTVYSRSAIPGHLYPQIYYLSTLNSYYYDQPLGGMRNVDYVLPRTHYVLAIDAADNAVYFGLDREIGKMYGSNYWIDNRIVLDYQPSGLAISGSFLLAVNNKYNAVPVYSKTDGRLVSGTIYQFSQPPNGITTDILGNIYVTGTAYGSMGNSLYKFAPLSAAGTTTLLQLSLLPDGVGLPAGLAVDYYGTIYVADNSTAGGVHKYCYRGVCNRYLLTCSDNQKDGPRDHVETDMDCGGLYCPGCGIGGKCVAASDCASINCDANTQRCTAAPGGHGHGLIGGGASTVGADVALP